MPSFQFQSNLPIILLIIVIALISLYFFLDLKKVKLVNEELEKKNDMVIKEIDNIHLRLHKFFSGMPKGIVPQTKIPSAAAHVKPVENTEVNESIDAVASDKVQKTNSQPIPEISEDEFNNIKKSTSNNIFGEIISDNNITQENNIVRVEGDGTDDNIVVPELLPISYDSEHIITNLGLSDNDEDDDEDDEVDDEDEDEDDDEDDEVDDVDEDDEVDDIDSEEDNISDDLDEDKLEIYMKYSVKELKDKCVEMNLKHSGNKSTLAKRIVDNLK